MTNRTIRTVLRRIAPSYLIGVVALCVAACAVDASDEANKGSGGKADDVSPSSTVLVDLVLHDDFSALVMFPQNGYFVFDDHEAFLDRFWSEFTTRVSEVPEPDLTDGDVVVGFVTHYSPLAGKRTSVAVEETVDKVVVDLLITWTAFGCFELISDVQLFDVVQVSAGGRPVELTVHTTRGPGCPGGVEAPVGEPRLKHEFAVGPEDNNRFQFCETTGQFHDAPFENCEVVQELPPAAPKG
jgi:hypothetical protein